MPTYEYLCDACENHFEQVQKITEDALKTCPKCGEDKLKRLVNAAAFHLKGSGWYKTDYASSSSSSGASTSSVSPSSGAATGSDNKTKEASTETKKESSASESKSTPSTPSNAANK